MAMTCECGHRAVSFRKNRKRHGELIIFADKQHTLCPRCQQSLFEAEKQKQIAEREKYESGNQEEVG